MRLRSGYLTASGLIGDPTAKKLIDAIRRAVDGQRLEIEDFDGLFSFTLTLNAEGAGQLTRRSGLTL
jgi:hypothetical protein